MTDPIDITGLEKAAVLAALYNRAKPQGLGFLHYLGEDMTVEQAREITDGDGAILSFDYIYGRVMHVDLSGDTINPSSYDHDNGRGTAREVITKLRVSSQTGVQDEC